MQVLYPGFLWGLLAIGVPIAVHLLQLRRPQRVLFTNTGFIREVELTTMRRRRLQEMLVLFTRVLAILFLVLLFCQPFIPVATNALPSTGQIEVFLDDSGSMQAMASDGESLGQDAVAGAQALGKSYGADARFRLLGIPGEIMGQSAYVAEVGRKQGAKQLPGWGGVENQAALQQEQANPVYLFSDFQKSSARSEVLKNIKTRGEVVLVPMVARPTGNIYVDSVWLNDAFVRVRTNVALHIRLRNGGIAAVTDCPVKVLLGEQQVGTFRVSVAAGATSEMVVQVQLSDAKLALGQVVTQDAPVTFDNTYYFTLQPAAAIAVLEIGEAPATRAAYAAEPLFTYAFARPQAVDYGVLRRADLVIVNEVTQLAAGLREALAGVLRRGGSVVVVPAGSPAAHSVYQELFRALGIVGEQWMTGMPARQEVALPSAHDPFFKDVFGAQPQRVAMPQVAPVLRMEQAGTDILRLRDGDGFLTQFGSGSGRAYVFAAPFAKEYSDFAAHALFVPVLYRLAMLSYQADQQPAYRLTTRGLALTVPPTTERGTGDEAGYRLVQDSLTFVPSQRVQGGQLHLEVPPSLTTPGFYQLTKQGKVVTTLAFNPAKGESELAAYSAAELRQLIGPNHPNVQVLENGAQPQTLARYRAGQTGQPLWRYCLLVVLACLLAEGLLLRFGRRGARAKLAVA